MKRTGALAPYLIPHLLLSVIAAASFSYGYRTYVYVTAGWIFLTALDSVIVADNSRWRRLIEISEDGPAWKCLLYAAVPLYFAFLLGGCLVAINEARNLGEFALTTAVIGSTGAVLVIPAAHELMHGGRTCDRATAIVLMCAFSYPHFCIEHASGHHRNVATVMDPATARYGEGFYTFYPRAVSWSLIDAWVIEAARLHRRGVTVMGPQNRLLQYLAILALIYTAIGYCAGATGLLFFALQGVVGFSTLEAINYVQHYGLLRIRKGPGDFETVRRIHSWDSYHLVSNWCLFNLPQHARHHAMTPAMRGGPTSRDDAPRLPLGYFALLWLAWFPPLWRSLMDPRVKKWRSDYGVSVGGLTKCARQRWRRVEGWGVE